MTKIVTSLLALAVSSSVVLAQGWSGAPGKGLSYDGGEAFSFKMTNQLQTHYVYAANEDNAAAGDNGEDESSFRVRRARTSFTGNAFSKDIHYVLTVDAVDDGDGDNGNIKDGHVTWNFLSLEDGAIGLRMGQGKAQFGLEGTGSSKGLFFPERSMAAREFSDARTTGAWLMGAYNNNSLRWALGANNGQFVGEQAANDDSELSYVASVNFDPMGDFTGGKGNEGIRQGDFREGDRPVIGTIGVGFAHENAKDLTFSPNDLEGQAFNVNTAWSVQGFQAMGEWFQWTLEEDGVPGDITVDGFALSATYVLPKNADAAIQWGFGARYSTVDLTEALDDEYTDISLVANAFYHGHACKTQIELTQREADLADTTDYVFTVAFQLLF